MRSYSIPRHWRKSICTMYEHSHPVANCTAFQLYWKKQKEWGCLIHWWKSYVNLHGNSKSGNSAWETPWSSCPNGSELQRRPQQQEAATSSKRNDKTIRRVGGALLHSMGVAQAITLCCCWIQHPPPVAQYSLVVERRQVAYNCQKTIEEL